MEYRSIAPPEEHDESSHKAMAKDIADETEKEDVATPRTTTPKPVASSGSRYTIPPTVLHDGKLFRKVG